MKDSSGWVRQSTVDKAAKDVIAERGCTVAELKPYWVAKKLGVDPSGEIYDKVYDFQRRMEAENTVPAIELPVEAEAALRNALEHSNAEVMAIVLRTLRSVVGAIYHATGLRIADAELRASRERSARVDLLALCRKAETDRDAAREQVDQLRQELDDAKRREERLLGRLEQREHEARAQTTQAGEAATLTDKPQPDMAALAYALAYGPPDEEDGDVDGGNGPGASIAADPTSEAIGRKDQPPAIATDRPMDGQEAMPPVTDAAADKADGNGDGHG